MAFDQNSIPKDLRPINMVNPHRTDLTGPPSAPVYFVPATFDSNVSGLGHMNPGQASGVANWGARMPAPNTPPAANPTQPSISPSGFAQNPSFGVRIGSNAAEQTSDDGGEDSVSGKKVKLLCSFGGKILPRPADGVLRYVGGQTRIISVRKDVSFGDLVQKMADVYGQPVVIKYQLPDEDLDALVSISCLDDLENMMDEYDKLSERSSDGSAKLRVFLFSTSELDSSGMVQFGDLQDSSQKYVEALNGVMDIAACGITRKASIASLTSTQNSDLSGADANEASLLGQDGTPSSDASPTTPAGNSGFPLPVPVAPGVSQYGQSQPETLLERTMPLPVSHQPGFGFDLQTSNFPPPPPPPYLQTFVDPQQDASNSADYQKLPSQVIYTNHPHMVATTRPVLLQPQFHENVAPIAHQRFIPVPQMTVAPPSSHPSVNPGMMPRLMPQQQVVAFPDQGYNAYHPQVGPGRVAGYWPQVPTTQEHVPYSEVRMPHQQVIQKMEDCSMCQKQLPHAHSDGVVQEQRDSTAATIADVNSMYRSLRVEDTARFQPVNSVAVPSQADAITVSRNLEVPAEVDMIAFDPPRMLPPQNVGQSRPEDGVQHFIPPISHVRPEFSVSKPAKGEAAVGVVPFVVTEPLVHEPKKDHTLPVLSQNEPVNLIDGILDVDQPKDGISTQQSQPMVGREQFSNDPFSKPALFSEASAVLPVTSPSDLETALANSNVVNWSGNVQGAPNSLFVNHDPWNFCQEPHYPPPRPSKLAARKEPFAPRDFFHESQLGHELEPNPQPHILDAPNPPLKYTIKDQGSSDDLIKKELQATAEGVAASVLKSSLASSADKSSDANQERDLPNNSCSMIQPKLEVKLEKVNLGFPRSDDRGNLQIIKNSDLEELRELGSGTFGTVYHGKWRGTDVAIKRINERCFAGKQSEQERMREDFWNEAVRLAELHHPNVVAFYGVVLDGPGGSIATVTEYMVNGSLRSALQKNERSIDMRKLLMIAMDAAFGMEYLHSKNIVHFDLKSDNLLVNLRDPHRPICKVGDLGLSKVKCKTLISGGVRGTLPWMAPELLNGSSSLVSEKVDVFSFGIVMWELLTGEEPYSDLHYGAIIGGIVSNTLRPSVPGNCDPDWRALMEKCWSAEPSERPSFTAIANELRLMAGKIPPKAPATNTRTQVQGG